MFFVQRTIGRGAVYSSVDVDRVDVVVCVESHQNVSARSSILGFTSAGLYLDACVICFFCSHTLYIGTFFYFFFIVCLTCFASRFAVFISDSWSRVPTVYFQGKVVTAPFFFVTFADFWLADQLNSMVTLFTDIQYFVCFYVTNGSWVEGNGIS